MSIHTSIGTPTADSYVSVNSADEYLNGLEEASCWVNIEYSTNATAAITRKENILKQATREIDFTYRFHESKYNQGIIGQDTYQNLEFPRYSNTDANSDLFIPDEIKYATYEQALWILKRADKRTSEKDVPKMRKTIGEVTYAYLRPWVNRQVRPINKYPWQGSKH